ncbi:hypothetical protein AOR13_3770 [Alteromonas stellipolaris LMG 21856]|nr:hypothetical protein AOR13_3770 [Alteromonas stellipolaris LMG 21856]
MLYFYMLALYKRMFKKMGGKIFPTAMSFLTDMYTQNYT